MDGNLDPVPRHATLAASKGGDDEAGLIPGGNEEETGVAARARAIPEGPHSSEAVISDAACQDVTATADALDLEFHLAVDVIYHRARADWFAKQHRFFLFVTLLLGSAAATDVAGAKFCAFLAAAFAALDLVLDPSSRTIEHRDIARDTLAIITEFKRNAFSEEACSRAKDEEMRLSAFEPAPYHKQRDKAFNQAITAFGRDPEGRAPLSMLHRACDWGFERR